MKVLIVIPAIGLVYGGTSKVVVALAQKLAEQGVMVDLVTTTANGDTASLEVETNCWITDKNVRFQYFPYFNWGDYKYSFQLQNWLYDHVRDYDLVHTNGVFSLLNLPVYWACQKNSIPYLVTPHGMLEPWALSYKSTKKKIFYHLLEKPAINQAHGIQALASPEKENLAALNLKPSLYLIPNGIFAEDFHELPSPSLFFKQFPETKNRQLILFLARLDPKKGLDLLAPVFAHVHKQFPEAHLVIAGPDNIGYLPTAKGYFQELDCLDAVTFTGMLTGDLKLSALSAADIYIAPSYSEGFSMSILEAMASGLPSIFTNKCNFPEAQEANVAKVVDVNSDRIVEALLWCLSNPQEAKSMGDRAKQFILEHYTWEQIAKKLVHVYRQIVPIK